MSKSSADVTINDIDLEEINIDTVKAHSKEMKAALDAEVNDLKVNSRIDGVEELERPITSKEELAAFMDRSLERLNKVGSAAQELEDPSHRKSPEQMMEALNDLVRQQDRFLVEMKVAQFYMTQFVIDDYEKIQAETDVARIHKYNTDLRENLNRLDTMPSLDSFREGSAEIGKLASMYSTTEAVIRSGNEGGGSAVDNTVTRVLAAGASQAFRENTASFNKFIAGDKGQTAVASNLEGIARESAFVYGVSKAFEANVVVSEATVDGKVLAVGGATDRAIDLGKRALLQIPLPAFTQVASAALSVASFAHTSQKEAETRNRAKFAGDLRGEVVGEIARKMHAHYSQETKGTSRLDAYSKKGQVKFADAVVETLMDRVGKFQFPSQEEIEAANLKVDDSKLNPNLGSFDPNYCEDLSQRWGISIDQGKLNQDDYRSNIAMKLESKIYANFVADSLVAPIVSGKEIVHLSGFEKDDFAKPKDYLAQNQKGVVALLEAQVKEGKTPFKVPSEMGMDKAVESLVNDYQIAKAAKTDLTHEEFLKNSAINSGEKSTFGFGGRQRDPSRENFNQSLKAPLMTLLDAVDRERSEAAIEAKLKATNIARSEDKKSPQEQTEVKDSSANPKQTINTALNMIGGHVAEKEDIEKEKKDLEDKLKKSESGLKWRPVKQFFTKASFGIYKGGNSDNIAKEDKNIEDLKSSISTINERLEVMREGQSNGEIAALVDDFKEEAARETKVAKGVSMDGLVNEARAVAETIDLDHSVASLSRSNSQRSLLSEQAATSLDKGGIVAKATVDGKVGATQDVVDIGIQVVDAVVSQVPVLGVAAGLTLAAAQHLNDQKKDKANETVANFASNEEGKKAVADIAARVHEYYSVSVDGAPSALDALSEKGQKKFIDHLVSGILMQVAKDPSKANDVDGLVGSVVNGAGSSKLMETLTMDKLNFTKEDLAEGKQGEKFTAQGLAGRIGIVTPDGRRYLSEDRAESAKGDSKYGYRMATPQEISEIDGGKPIAGYKEFTAKGNATVTKPNELTAENLARITVPNSRVDPYAKIDSAKERSPEELQDLKQFQDFKKRDHVASNISSERTDFLSASVAAVTTPLKAAFAGTPDSKLAEKEAVGEYADAKKRILSVVRPDHLKSEFTKDGVEQAVVGFIQGYHAKVMDGANKQELRDFAKENLPVNNKQLTKDFVDLAVVYSEARIAKAIVNREINGGAKVATTEATSHQAAHPSHHHNASTSFQSEHPSHHKDLHLSKSAEDAIHGIEEVLRHNDVHDAGKGPISSKEAMHNNSRVEQMINARGHGDDNEDGHGGRGG